MDDQTIFWDEVGKMKNLRHCQKTKDENGTLSLLWDSVGEDASKFTYCCMDPRKIVTGRDVSNDENVEAFHANWVIGIDNKIKKLKTHIYGGGALAK